MGLNGIEITINMTNIDEDTNRIDSVSVKRGDHITDITEYIDWIKTDKEMSTTARGTELHFKTESTYPSSISIGAWKIISIDWRSDFVTIYQQGIIGGIVVAYATTFERIEEELEKITISF